jgi:2-polyprenyl-3-methyl-5-hydroxy-6-metoxy-1,4-benzoquinol methylase
MRTDRYSLKRLAKSALLATPLVGRRLHDLLAVAYRRSKLIVLGRERLFTRLSNRESSWGGKESVSGRGSDTDQTRLLVQELSELFAEFGVHSILDLPCGDFSWFRRIVLPERVAYVGADINRQLIESNRRHHQMPNVQFRRLDVISDVLPNADVVLCRDCLIHLSNGDALSALKNICRTGSKYLVTTTYTSRIENKNIVTGGFRPLNLQISPFVLPPPIKLITEGCTHDNGKYWDKSLGVWMISDVRAELSRSRQTPLPGSAHR